MPSPRRSGRDFVYNAGNGAIRPGRDRDPCRHGARPARGRVACGARGARLRAVFPEPDGAACRRIRAAGPHRGSRLVELRDRGLPRRVRARNADLRRHASPGARRASSLLRLAERPAGSRRAGVRGDGGQPSGDGRQGVPRATRDGQAERNAADVVLRRVPAVPGFTRTGSCRRCASPSASASRCDAPFLPVRGARLAWAARRDAPRLRVPNLSAPHRPRRGRRARRAVVAVWLESPAARHVPRRRPLVGSLTVRAGDSRPCSRRTASARRRACGCSRSVASSATCSIPSASISARTRPEAGRRSLPR